MRISGGTARGIPLKVPPGDAVRPATDGMRQSVFSSLAPRLPGARFADLFAGSGSYGLEALSRGAEFGLFVEKSAKAAACLRANLDAVAKSLGRPPESTGHLLQMEVMSAPLAGQNLDLVFIDPPYEIILELGEKLLAKLATELPRERDPILLFEMPGEYEIQNSAWTCFKRLGKGRRQPSVCFYRLT